MGAIDNFLKRRGYAKLDRYGLVLTPDDRVLSSRPAVLDDGLGGKIVGWIDGDLAAMELEKWSPAPMPAAAKTVAVTGRLQPPERPKASPAQRPLPGVAPTQTAPVAVASAPSVAPAPIAAPSAPAPAPAMMIAPPAMVAPAPIARSPLPAAMAAPKPAPVEEDDEAEWERIRQKMAAVPAAPVPRAPVVAAEPELTEDEWEWEIAMARSRAAADEVVQSAAAMQFTKPKGPAPKAPGKTLQMAAVASPSKPAPAPYAARKPYTPMAQSPKTMPMAAVAPSKPEPMPEWPKTEPLHESWEERTEATAPVAEAAPAKRSTVIPVPQLPVAARPSDVRPPASSRTISPRTRVARGTGREDTVQIQAAPASNEETSPYVTIPAEVRSPGYAHTKRAAAKHR